MGIEATATQLMTTINGLLSPWHPVSEIAAAMCTRLLGMVNLDEFVAGIEERAQQKSTLVGFAHQAKKLITSNHVDRLVKLCDHIIKESEDGG